MFFRLLTQLHKLRRSQLWGSFFIWFHFRSSPIWFISYTFAKTWYLHMWNLHVIFTSGLSLRKLNIYIFHSATESAAVILKQLDNVHKKNMINLSPRYCALNFQKCSTLNYVRKFSLWMLTTLWLVEVKPGFGAQKKCPFPLNRGLPLIKVTNTKIMWTFFVE